MSKNDITQRQKRPGNRRLQRSWGCNSPRIRNGRYHTNILGNDISDEASPANVAADISEKYGVRVGIVQGDVGAEENGVRIVNNCIALFGGVDGIVSNAMCSMIPR